MEETTKDKLFEETEAKLCYKLDAELYLPVKEQLKDIGRTHSLGHRKEDFKQIIHEELTKLKKKIKWQKNK